MGFDGVRLLVQVRKSAIRSIRTSSRSVRNHPFLVGAILFVIFLYRSSPFLFSLLVSASPVLVCTAVLLGALLSLGQPQIPQIEKDEKISSEISSLRAVSMQHTTIFQKEAVVFGRDDPYTDARSQISADKGVEEASLLGDACSVGKFVDGTLTPQNSQEIVFEHQSADEATIEYENRKVEVAKENREEMVAFEGMPSTYEVQGRGFEIDRSAEGSVDGHTDDQFVSSSVPWTRVNGDHNDDGGDEDEDEPSDSGSDGAESSSPDPSMADIIPLLDELHPLIESENLIPGNLSRENSGLLSNTSHNSHESSINSDEESDHKEEEEAGDDDDDDDDAEQEEENQVDKEDAAKSAITWTEDDQKNLMDLGTSELERNQRLESLIARRRARRMMVEKNLIDLDFDLPFQVPAISTTRQNPFDFPNETYDNMGLPPIPGSAPSILLPRRNPFDLPYDSSEEKPDLMGDSFQQEFMELNQKEAVKEPVFRRHESFHMGSSFFDFPRQEGRGANRTSRFRPYFIPERLASEGTSSPSFMRQPSDISEESSSFQRQTSELSATSSFHRQTSGISVSSSFQRQSSDMSESKASSAAETEPVCEELDQEEAKLSDHNPVEERIPDSGIDHSSDRVERGSQLSDNIDDQYEKRELDRNMPEIRLGWESETYSGTEFHQSERGHIVEINLGNNGNDPEVDSWMSEGRNLAASAGNIAGEMHLMAKPVKEKDYSSSSSSSSEEHNDVEDVEEGFVRNEEIGLHLIEKSDVQDEKFFEAPAFHHHHSGNTHSAERGKLETIEEEHISSSSSSLVSDEHKSTGLKLDEALVNMEHIRPDVDNKSDAPAEQALDVSNFTPTMDAEDSHSKDPVYDSSPQAAKNHLSISSENTVEEFAELENKDLKQERDGLWGKYDHDADTRVHEEVREKVYDSSTDCQYTASDDLNLSTKEEMHADAFLEHSSSAQADLFSIATESTEEPKLVNEDALLSKETSSYPLNLVDVPGNVKGKVASLTDEGDSVKDVCSIYPPTTDYKEEPSVIAEKLEEVSNANKMDREVNVEMNDLYNLSLQTDATSSHVQELGQEPVTDFFDFGEPIEERSEIEFQKPDVRDGDGKLQFGGSIVPEEIMNNEIKDIAEALLSELDAVGDFCVTEVGMNVKQDTSEVEKTNAPEAIFINESELKVENAEDGVGEFPDSHISESKTWFQVLEPESSENIGKSSDENAEKSAPEVLFISEIEPEVENAEAGMDELPDPHVLENNASSDVLEPESIENLEQSSDENAKTSAPEVLFIDKIDPKEENAETAMGELDSCVLESKTSLDVLEPESSQDAERSGTIESRHLQDEIPREETEDGSTKDSESIITADEPVTFHGNRSDLEKDEPAADICGSAPAREEEIKSSGVASTVASSNPDASKNNTVIEKDEPATGDKEVPEINIRNALEVETHQAESSTDVTMQFEAEQPTSPRAVYNPAISSSLQSETAEFQALQVEDHQIDRTPFSVGQLEASTENTSAAETADGHGSIKAPDMPNEEK